MQIRRMAHQLAFNDWLFDKLSEFVCQYTAYKKDEFKKTLRTHYIFKTMDYGIDKQGIVYFARWNIDRDTVNVLDLYIREDLRNTGIIKRIFLKNIIFWPGITKMKFVRMKKYPFKPEKEYKINKFLQGDKHGRRHQYRTT